MRKQIIPILDRTKKKEKFKQKPENVVMQS